MIVGIVFIVATTEVLVVVVHVPNTASTSTYVDLDRSRTSQPSTTTYDHTSSSSLSPLDSSAEDNIAMMKSVNYGSSTSSSIIPSSHTNDD